MQYELCVYRPDEVCVTFQSDTPFHAIQKGDLLFPIARALRVRERGKVRPDRMLQAECIVHRITPKIDSKSAMTAYIHRVDVLTKEVQVPVYDA